ncbi:DNA helicase [Betaproteobacteria bacterium]|nr:DNA helicase [Betaproteobacteria bacterium]GHT99765.1 DNA helicase [Betaproteobacteria bacterium]GHU21310.1 DNA helicase [Betaproteobacteria bacterium]
MNFLISDTFTASLARLNGEEQKAVKTTAFDLQLNPANPGHHFHKLDKAKDKRFWSVRVGSDVRIIVHRTHESLLLCYVNHHDNAYDWAERRRLETHPTTGAAQFVEIIERVEEIRIPASTVPKKATLFAGVTDAQLLSYGVPQVWLAEVKTADEDELLELSDHLPSEAAEALLELATGGQPVPAVLPDVHPFQHPDAQRRFRVLSDANELKMALDFPWDKWTLFLHPAQRQAVEREYSGSVRISGSAGTGKTIVALHRVNQLLRHKEGIRVLLTTFSEPLANALKNQLFRLLHDDPRLADCVDIMALDAIGLRLYDNLKLGKPKLLDDALLYERMQAAAESVPDHKFRVSFLVSEWRELVDSWQLETWADYKDVKRLGRKTRLSETQREVVWRIFVRLHEDLKALGVATMAQIFTRLALHYADTDKRPFDYIAVDEAQDLSIPQMRFLAALGAGRPDALFFTGDIGQRIFQPAFSWKTLGIDIRGRSRTLTVNYRTSHQIRKLADRLLTPEISDVDGNTERRLHTVSVFNGVNPVMRIEKTHTAEISAAANWLKARITEGITPQEIGVFVRSEQEIPRASAALSAAGIPYAILDKRILLTDDVAAVSTMSLAKGLEFRVVAVMACDENVLPSTERIASITDESDLQEVQETERHLFYVACTRARDALFISSGGRHSEFLDDLAR